MTERLYTTFALAKRYGACRESYRKVAKALGGITNYGRNTPVYIDDLAEVAGMTDAIWALYAVPKAQEATRDRLARLFACDCAEHVLKPYEDEHGHDSNNLRAIKAARKFAVGEATKEELEYACDHTRGPFYDCAVPWIEDVAWETSESAIRIAGRPEEEWQLKRFLEVFGEEQIIEKE